jgi:hypothetical protein
MLPRFLNKTEFAQVARNTPLVANGAAPRMAIDALAQASMPGKTVSALAISG